MHLRVQITCVRMRACTHRHMHAHAHMHARAHMYTDTHKHIQAQAYTLKLTDTRNFTVALFSLLCALLWFVPTICRA